MLDTEATLEIQQLVAEFKPGNADLLRALHKVHHRYGYIPKESMAVVANRLELIGELLENPSKPPPPIVGDEDTTV